MGRENPESRLQQMMADEAHRPFNLEMGPLFRVRLFRLSETDQVFMLTIHHIVSDGWSLRDFLHRTERSI